MNLNVPERSIPPNLMREGAAVRILDSHSEVEYTKPPDYLQVIISFCNFELAQFLEMVDF